MKNYVIGMFAFFAISFGVNELANDYQEGTEPRDEDAAYLQDFGNEDAYYNGLQLDEQNLDEAFLWDVWSKVKSVASSVFDAAKSLGSSAVKMLNKLGISNEMLKQIPEKVIKAGASAVQSYAEQKGMIPAGGE